MEWLVILPDHEGAVEKRVEVRPKHLEAIAPLHKSNFWLLGGAFFHHPPAEGESPPPFAGSAMLAYAETKEEVMEKVKSDIYATSGVWDLSKVQIWPFKSAIRSDISANQG